MRDLIAGQRVKPRHKPSLLSKAMAYKAHAGGKPADSGIRRRRQKPVRQRREGIKKPLNIFLPHISLPALFPVFVIGGMAALLFLVLIFDTSFLLPGERIRALEPGEDTEYGAALASYAGLVSSASHPEDSIPLDLMETFTWLSYRVKRGDSVSRIARDYGISMDAVIACNGIRNAKRLREGETLRIPNMDGIPYTVKRGDSLAGISSSFKVPLEAILDANDIESETIVQGTVLFIPGARMPAEDLRLALGELFVYPIRGRLTSSFGWRLDPISGVRRFHAALDLAASTGTTVKAAMDGRIATVGYNATYGNYIIMSHSGGYQTLYAHLHSVSVRKDAAVNQGSKIGEVGNTGYSTGPHLHFAVFRNGKAVNPLDYLHQ